MFPRLIALFALGAATAAGALLVLRADRRRTDPWGEVTDQV